MRIHADPGGKLAMGSFPIPPNSFHFESLLRVAPRAFDWSTLTAIALAGSIGHLGYSNLASERVRERWTGIEPPQNHRGELSIR